jgi:hypothetical protein
VRKPTREIDASENKKPPMSGASSRVWIPRLHLRVNATNPHPLVEREVSEGHAHAFLVLGADVSLDFLGLDASEFRNLAKRVHAFRAVERVEEAGGEQGELTQDHRGGDGGERLVLGGVALLGFGFAFAGVVVHGMNTKRPVVSGCKRKQKAPTNRGEAWH